MRKDIKIMIIGIWCYTISLVFLNVLNKSDFEINYDLCSNVLRFLTIFIVTITLWHKNKKDKNKKDMNKKD